MIKVGTTAQSCYGFLFLLAILWTKEEEKKKKEKKVQTFLLLQGNRKKTAILHTVCHGGGRPQEGQH